MRARGAMVSTRARSCASCLVDNDDVGGPDLVEGQIAIACVRVNGQIGVYQRDHVVDVHQALRRRGQERLGHGDWAGDTASLDDNVVGQRVALQKFDHFSQQIVADCAADAAVGEADGLALHGHNQLGVDVDRAKVIDEDGDSPAVGMVQDMVDQRGLTRAEKPADDGNRHQRGGPASIGWRCVTWQHRLLSSP